MNLRKNSIYCKLKYVKVNVRPCKYCGKDEADVLDFKGATGQNGGTFASSFYKTYQKYTQDNI